MRPSFFFVEKEVRYLESDTVMSVLFRNVAIMPLFFLSGFLVGQLEPEAQPPSASATYNQALVSNETASEISCINRIQSKAHDLAGHKQNVVTVFDEPVDVDFLRGNTLASSLVVYLE